LFNQVRQVSVFHLIEGREALEKLQSALDVLQHRGFPCLCEGVRFTHNLLPQSFFELLWWGDSVMVGPCAQSAHWT
jgi:hypothetical protein